MDETRAPVLDPKAGKTKTGYLWVLTRDDRGWGGGDPPAVVFTYAPGRHGSHAMDILTGFDGILQVDGYTVYNALAEPKRVGGKPLTLAYCWPIPGASCMTSIKKTAPRSRPKACAASPRSTRSRPASGAGPPRNALPPARRNPRR